MATTTYEPAAEVCTRVVIEPMPVGEPAKPWVRRRPAPMRPVPMRPVPVRPVPLACDGSAPPSVHGSRLTRRGRMALAVAWLALLIVGALGVVRPWQESNPAPGSTSGTSVVRIQPGDTLWDVAGDVAPSADPRETVGVIVQLNGLASAGDIRPGDRLVVPVSG